MQECGCVVNNKKIYCASQSQARHDLLRHAKIPFVVVDIAVNEEDAVVSGTVQEQVAALAQYKHTGIQVSLIARRESITQGRLYFVTADTLIAGVTNGKIYGKPRNRAHAIEMVAQISSQEIIVATGMCLSVWEYDAVRGEWCCVANDTWVADARAEFFVPEGEIEQYLDACPIAMKGCGATVIDGIGISYFKSIHGSYTGTLGLDMFGLHTRLVAYGFYASNEQ